MNPSVGTGPGPVVGRDQGGERPGSPRPPPSRSIKVTTPHGTARRAPPSPGSAPFSPGTGFVFVKTSFTDKGRGWGPPAPWAWFGCGANPGARAGRRPGAMAPAVRAAVARAANRHTAKAKLTWANSGLNDDELCAWPGAPPPPPLYPLGLGGSPGRSWEPPPPGAGRGRGRSSAGWGAAPPRPRLGSPQHHPGSHEFDPCPRPNFFGMQVGGPRGWRAPAGARARGRAWSAGSGSPGPPRRPWARPRARKRPPAARGRHPPGSVGVTRPSFLVPRSAPPPWRATGRMNASATGPPSRRGPNAHGNLPGTPGG